ncbi:MAG: hypothetical protein COX62_05460 [Deltaproteobacteria bacterium CG_4_10_14_0_2_um_filter_43_8]|nr:MAG: hypothetical protein COV43_01555 [Deltaproteobacteria bacterium CG11_big_fil_rev_8_21_14_0_20_42_23]PJA19980.1 MAG: hypothetical protein COX62_05460 [Deltaproteobacteria bacterium CG_4_10_14_0_2_um_filter_43_8]PJC64655.1 MAG: hypothetical protein CO021_03070 [Deltaproteobacteria bacterium CG_4_9_14_0_2_um_filter_42_21]
MRAMKHKYTIADMLTLSRLALVPVFVLLFFLSEHLYAVLCFAIAGFTDLIDGTVARLLKQPSKLGAILDPVADKLLVESCFVLLTIVGILPWWFFAIAFTRDFFILCGIYYLERNKISFRYEPVLTSKFATLFQLSTAVLGLIFWWKPFLQLGSSEYVFAFQLFLFVSAGLIALSALQYFITGLKILKHNVKKKKEMS